MTDGNIHDPNFSIGFDPVVTKGKVINRTDYTEHISTGSITGAQITFEIPAGGGGFIDLSKSYIATRTRVLPTAAGASDAAGYARPGRQQQAPGEGISDLLWSNIETRINGVEISDSQAGLTPYTAFYSKTLTKPASWANAGCMRVASVQKNDRVDGEAVAAFTELTAATLVSEAGWGAQHAGYAKNGFVSGDSTVIDHSPHQWKPWLNQGDAFRMLAWGGDVRTMPYNTVITVPEAGIWRSGVYLPPGVTLRVTLTKSPSLFYMHTNGSIDGVVSTASLDFEGDANVTLMLKRIYPTDDIHTTFNKTWESIPMTIPIKLKRAGQRSISMGESGVNVANMIGGTRPETVIVAFIDDRAMSGSHQYAPFSTVDYDLNGAVQAHVTTIQVTWGGERFPASPLTIKSVGDLAVAYANYLSACESHGGFDMFGKTGMPFLSYAEFRARPFYCFDVRSDNRPTNAPGHIDEEDYGSLTVRATFGGTMPNSQICVFGFGNASVSIPKNGSVQAIGF
jgi:hypothetical protein